VISVVPYSGKFRRRSPRETRCPRMGGKRGHSAHANPVPLFRQLDLNGLSPWRASTYRPCVKWLAMTGRSEWLRCLTYCDLIVTMLGKSFVSNGLRCASAGSFCWRGRQNFGGVG